MNCLTGNRAHLSELEDKKSHDIYVPIMEAWQGFKVISSTNIKDKLFSMIGRDVMQLKDKEWDSDYDKIKESFRNKVKSISHLCDFYDLISGFREESKLRCRQVLNKVSKFYE